MRHYAKHFTKHLAHGFAFLFLIIFFLHFFHILPGFWGGKTIYFFFAFLIIASIFLIFQIHEIPHDERENAGIVRIISYLFIISIIPIILESFISIPAISDLKFEIISLSIFLGILTCYATHRKVERSLQETLLKEENEEKDRGNNFSHRHPILNKIPILNIILKWIYKEGIGYVLILFLILALTFILRVWQVGKLGLMADESFTYYVGKNLIENHSFYILNEGPYYRGWPYTILVAISFLLFGVSEFALRLPGVVISTLTVFVVYLFLKKVSGKKIAIFGSLLLCFFTWQIFYSRYARHYVLSAFLLLLSTYFLYLYFQKNSSKYKYASITTTGLLVLTLKELLIIPFVYFFLILVVKKFRMKIKDYIIFTLGYCIPVAITLFIPEKGVTGEAIFSSDALLFRVPQWVAKWLAYDSHRLYFISLIYNILPILFVFVFILLFVSILSAKRNNNLIFLFAPFILFIIMNVIGRDKSWTPRQLSFMLPFFILLVTYAFMYLKRNRFYQILLGIILFVGICQPIQIYQLYTLDYGKPVNNTIFQITTAESAYADYKTTSEYIINNFQEGDIVLADFSVSRVYLYGKVPLYFFSDLNQDRDILMVQESLISSNRVWILNSNINDYRSHFKNRKGEIRAFLDKNEDKIVYIGKDNISKVYLFNREYEQQ